MRAVWLFLRISAVSLSTVVACPLALAQNDVPVLRIREAVEPRNNVLDLAPAAVPPHNQVFEVGVRAFPRVALGAGHELQYVGEFSAYGKFKQVSKLGRLVDSLITASVHDKQSTSPEGVQLFLGLTSKERIIDDLEPPGHAVKAARIKSPLADVRDVPVHLAVDAIHLAVGTDGVLIAPNGVTTDSRQRVIVSDPAAHAVHVLDYPGKASFRIVGGPGRRLQSPDGVAVDDHDNIYVSDYERGMVLVYDPEGSFLRYIGNFKGEGVYEGPSGIAIDRRTGRIYLIDRPRHRLFILDLQGNVLQENVLASSGEQNGSGGPEKFKQPVGVVVHNGEVFVLDANGARLQIFDLQGNFRKQFFVSDQSTARGRFAPSLCVADDGTIYVTDTARGTVRAYNRDGKLLGAFGQPGSRVGEFNSPAGIWADPQGRIYVADSANRRLQVFQLGGMPQHTPVNLSRSEESPSPQAPEAAGNSSLVSSLH